MLVVRWLIMKHSQIASRHFDTAGRAGYIGYITRDSEMKLYRDHCHAANEHELAAQLVAKQTVGISAHDKTTQN